VFLLSLPELLAILILNPASPEMPAPSETLVGQV
jgi:hypothetical protein